MHLGSSDLSPVHLIQMLYLGSILLYLQALFDRLSDLRMDFDGV